MEYTSELFYEFIKQIDSLNKKIKEISNIKNNDENDTYVGYSKKIDKIKDFRKYNNDVIVRTIKNKINRKNNQIEDTYLNYYKKNQNLFDELTVCLRCKAVVSNIENAISNREVYNKFKESGSYKDNINVEEIKDEIDYNAMVIELNKVIESGSKKEISYECSKFYKLCTTTKQVLDKTILDKRAKLVENKMETQPILENISDTFSEEFPIAYNDVVNKIYENSKKSIINLSENKNEYDEKISDIIEKFRSDLSILEQELCDKFSPQELLDEYIRVYSFEPSYDSYECASEMPKNIYVSTVEYNLSNLNLCEITKSILSKHYHFLIRNDKLSIPNCVTFGSDFNYLFEFNGDERAKVVKDACDMGMRLFMMLPPGKVNFTFIDPVSLGESYAMFTRLVNSDDRTSEVINGKIWSTPRDIEEKLRIMTEHIANVTQRCLQGMYENIYEYNKVAEQNAEAYQIIMLMDFPAGLTEQSLHLLEQISVSGPKCGVFTIIYKNLSQYSKVPEKSYPLISNIENGFNILKYENASEEILYQDKSVLNKSLIWNRIAMPTIEQIDSIISTLKAGIKSADKVVIGIEKVSSKDETIHEEEMSTKDGIRIPIGLHGANEVQYLSLGVGGSHHALIAGVAGSGKSSLLHTIILQALTQYGPDELKIYLVDFKRGVEFKIYADYKLPSFKVVAIESEREFGYNILKALEREQKIRADKFKRVRDRKIDRIEDYRALGGEYKMPRILVIMDEFHELFSESGDKIGKESAEMMERIVRQGRAFGVHIILSSQSYTNVGGLDKSVYDQMAVRIVLKCSKADATLLLGDGSNDVDQISIDDPGRAIYNSEAGNKEFNSHFRVAYIDPSKHRDILKDISDKTCKMSNDQTRILLSNIEDNKYSIFNQFTDYGPEECSVPGRLYLGEPLSVVNNLNMDLIRNEYANMLMIGSDSDKARSMFAFTMLSLAINYWVSHNKKAPKEPFIYFLNYKPLRDDYFIDAPDLLATEFLNKYVKNISIGNSNEIKDTIQKLYFASTDTQNSLTKDSKYLMVFGYQRAEDLKSEDKAEEKQDIMSMMSSKNQGPTHSMKEMIEVILTMGAQRGIHSVFWQDDFQSLDFADRKLITYFYQKIAFDMSKEDYSQFVGVNDISQFGENTAVYNNRIDDTRSFRPYQAPDKEWLEGICESLNK